MLTILKDSRIGTFGAVAVILCVLARWQALQYFSGPGILAVCIAAQTVPRAAMVGLAWTSRPVGSGGWVTLASNEDSRRVGRVGARNHRGVFVRRPRGASMAGSFVIVRFARLFYSFYRRRGAAIAWARLSNCSKFSSWDYLRARFAPGDERGSKIKDAGRSN